MRIAHIGLASFYTDGMAYQDNCLAEQNVKDGHEVLYISNAAKYVNGKIVTVGHEDTILNSGVHLIRLPYVTIGNKFITEKIRMVRGLYRILEKFEPDVILAHDLAYYSILDVVKYKKKHMQVRLYADTHTASYNSGRNLLSLHLLHRGFYRYLTHKALKYLDKYLYIGVAEKNFSIENYGVPEELMEFFPLGANIPNDEEYEQKRKKRRLELQVKEDEFLFAHSGKLDALKRTSDLLSAFIQVPQLNAKMVIIGMIPEEQEDVLYDLIRQDKRIIYLGWKSSDELRDYLCACDMYCQPGGVSATLQNAIGCYCPVMCYPHEEYQALDRGNFIWIESIQDMKNVFINIFQKKEDLVKRANCSRICAKELLDYRQIAKRYINKVE